MSYIWEEELAPLDDGLSYSDQWRMQHHLKVALLPSGGIWRYTLAWVTKVGEGKWYCEFADHQHDDKTFRSLKSAKAYALAIITLNQ